MFLDRQDFEDSIAIINIYKEQDTDMEIRLAVAEDFAVEMFPSFENMSISEKQDILNMILEDLEKSFVGIN